MNKIGRRIKALREEKGLQQKELAEILSIQRVSLNYYEMGTRLPKTEAIIAMSKFFGVSADYLLGLQDIPKNPPIRSGADIAYASDITGLPPSLIIALKSMKDTYTFCIGKITNNYILIDIGKRVLNVETDA